VFEANKQAKMQRVIGDDVKMLDVQELLNGVDLPTLVDVGRTRSGKEREPGAAPVRLFYSYSQKDELLRGQLETHLKLLQRQGLISTWHERMIEAGEERADVLSAQLDQAQIILLLVSSDFLASDNSDAEVRVAMEHHHAGKAVVIPVLLREVDWEGALFDGLQVLPTNKRPVTKWADRDSAWNDVSKEIKRTVEEIRKKRHH